jgi:alkylation response protein AidB-like acyl-CoA dehydrogenase
MQDGAARLLERHLYKNTGLSPTERQVFQNAYNHLTSRDPAKAWTSGQWMTERTGGSDVSRTETVAIYDPYPASSPPPLADVAEQIPLGPWSISGFKWFSSATDSQMTILLAKTAPDKGLSCFLAPTRRHNPSLPSPTEGSPAGGSELNGATISRLKRKFGTQSLPTAELELRGMRGWLVGEEGKGVREISTLLTITRVHTSVSCMGYLGRSLGIARAFALVREVSGAGAGVAGGAQRGRVVLLLASHPLHMRTLASVTVEYHALMLLVYYTLFDLGLDERGPPQTSSSSSREDRIPLRPPPQELVSPLLRVLSSLHKAYTCHATPPLVHECMAALGGVGYLMNDESPQIGVARLFRDACVGAIWEGTTDVLAGDTVRALLKKRNPPGKRESECLRALDWFVQTFLGDVCTPDTDMEKEHALGRIRAEWEGLKKRIELAGTAEQLLPEARGVVFRIAEVLMAVLYALDAARNPGAEIEEMCRRYWAKKGFFEGGGCSWQARGGLEMDQAIVYGAGNVTAPGQGQGQGLRGSKL